MEQDWAKLAVDLERLLPESARQLLAATQESPV